MSNDVAYFVSPQCLENLHREWAKWPALFAEMDSRNQKIVKPCVVHRSTNDLGPWTIRLAINVEDIPKAEIIASEWDVYEAETGTKLLFQRVEPLVVPSKVAFLVFESIKLEPPEILLSLIENDVEDFEYRSSRSINIAFMVLAFTALITTFVLYTAYHGK